ncbi:MAG: hypothetical protein AB7H77_06670 [Bdellovibrionales bacterium]
MKSQPNRAKPESADPETRIAAALRENLRKRKQQQEQRNPKQEKAD